MVLEAFNSELGVPQESALGPLLFLLSLNKVSVVANCCFAWLFVVDALITVVGSDFAEAVHTTNVSLEKVHVWLCMYKPKLNAWIRK